MTLPSLVSCGEALDPAFLGRMRDTAGTTDPATLRDQMEQDGYILLRGVLDPAKVLKARRRVMEQLASEDQLQPDTEVMDGVPKTGHSISHVVHCLGPCWCPSV